MNWMVPVYHLFTVSLCFLCENWKGYFACQKRFTSDNLIDVSVLCLFGISLQNFESPMKPDSLKIKFQAHVLTNLVGHNSTDPFQYLEFLKILITCTKKCFKYLYTQQEAFHFTVNWLTRKYH